MKAGGCTGGLLRPLYHQSVNFSPFACSHALFSKVFHEGSCLSEEHRRCNLSTFTVRCPHSAWKTRAQGILTVWTDSSSTVKCFCLTACVHCFPGFPILYQLVLLNHILKCDSITFLFFYACAFILQQMFIGCLYTRHCHILWIQN